MGMPCVNIGDFLKKDVPLVFRNSIVLTAVWLLLIPAIRGISNLNEIQSAQCLSQSISLTGIILIVPLVRPEMEAGVKEVIYTKPWPYLKSVLIRIVCGLVFSTLFILTSAWVMRLQNCSFPFWTFSGVTILYAAFMGLAGLALSQIGKNVIAGYLAAAGYWSLKQLEIIPEGTMLDLFPVIDGRIQIEKLLILLTVDGLLLLWFLLAVRRSSGGYSDA